jgi:hypothetical protein
MDPPRRRIVIFKGGGYIYSEMEALIESAGARKGLQCALPSAQA